MPSSALSECRPATYSRSCWLIVFSTMSMVVGTVGSFPVLLGGGGGGHRSPVPIMVSDLEHRAGGGQVDRAVVGGLGGAEVELGVGPRGDVGQHQPADAGGGGALPGLAAVEVQAQQAVVARLLEGGLGQQQVGALGQVVQ